jgi:hypothetical protein
VDENIIVKNSKMMIKKTRKKRRKETNRLCFVLILEAIFVCLERAIAQEYSLYPNFK